MATELQLPAGDHQSVDRTLPTASLRCSDDDVSVAEPDLKVCPSKIGKPNFPSGEAHLAAAVTHLAENSPHFEVFFIAVKTTHRCCHRCVESPTLRPLPSSPAMNLLGKTHQIRPQHVFFGRRLQCRRELIKTGKNPPRCCLLRNRRTTMVGRLHHDRRKLFSSALFRNVGESIFIIASEIPCSSGKSRSPLTSRAPSHAMVAARLAVRSAKRAVPRKKQKRRLILRLTHHIGHLIWGKETAGHGSGSNGFVMPFTSTMTADASNKTKRKCQRRQLRPASLSEQR
ncbi:hypothetical protein ACLOJK_027917 [Asimina triloba]